MFGLLTEAIARLQAAGLMRRQDVRTLALAAWSQVHGLAMLVLDGQVSGESDWNARLEALTRATTESLMFGMAAGS